MAAKILITMPRKRGDPTEYTYQWAEKAVKMAKKLGYDVITIEKEQTTYKNVTDAIINYKPRLYLHMGHGCPSSIQGQSECIVAKKYSVDQLICMAQSTDSNDRQRLLKLLYPLGGLSCPGICSLDNDPCSPLCLYDTNVHLLKGCIVYAVSCHSAEQLGKCAVRYGVQTYIGYDDLLMFPVDTINSQDMFGDVQLTMLKELLMGKSVQEAEKTMSELEDSLIRQFKTTKYIALPMLWNKLKRRTLGDNKAMIY